MQLVLDLLLQRVADQPQLAVLLQSLAADVQAQVLAVHHALDKAEVVGQQVGALVHDHHAGSVQRQALLVLLGVVVVGGAAGHEQQRGVGGGALGAAGDDPQRIGVVVEVVLVEVVVVLLGHVLLVPLPDGHHAVDGLQLGVALVLRLVVLAGVLRLGLLAALLAVHGDGVADVVAVLFDQIHQRVLFQVLAVVVVFGVLFQHHDDVGARLALLGLGQGVAFHAAGLPFPGLVAALGAGDDRDLAGHHKGGVEPDAELTDDVDVFVLVLGLEVHAAGPGDGAQVLLQLLPGHADAVVADGQGAAVPVGGDMDVQVLLADAHRGVGQAFEIELVAGVRRIGDQLAQEDLAVGVDGIDHQVQKLFALGLKLTHSHMDNPSLCDSVWI